MSTGDRLRGKSILITGAAQGIGLAIARACLNEGASTTLIDSDGAQLAEAVKELGGGTNVFAEVADIRDASAVVAVVDRSARVLPPVNALINNAGINVFRDPMKMTDEDWYLCLDVDLKGAWNCIRAVLPHLLRGTGGVVLNIASTHSLTIIPGSFPYPVAKHGLIGLTKAIGLEYAARGVRVNALAPGYVETRKVVDYWNSFPDPAAAREATLALHPGRRIAKPEEIASAAVFLISDECPFINATTLVADGGLSVLQHA